MEPSMIPDNHSAHTSKGPKTWLADQPAGRFEFTFNPHARLLAQSHRRLLLQAHTLMLRHIRVTSKQELKDRIMTVMNKFNRHHPVVNPVVHSWAYKLDRAA
jgi:hypothetical protein